MGWRPHEGGRLKEEGRMKKWISAWEIFWDAAAGEEGAAEVAEFVDGFGAGVVGIVDQSEMLIAQKDFQFAGGEGCGDARLQGGLIHEWGEDRRKVPNSKFQIAKVI